MSQSVSFVVPLLPGKTETERAALASMQSGERKADAVASRRRHGITREAAWIQGTPMGDMAVVLLEADDLACDLARHSRWIERLDATHARSAGLDRLPRLARGMPERSYRAGTGDDDA